MSPRTLAWTLIGSLGINIFVIGALSMHLLRHRSPPMRPPHHSQAIAPADDFQYRVAPPPPPFHPHAPFNKRNAPPPDAPIPDEGEDEETVKDILRPVHPLKAGRNGPPSIQMLRELVRVMGGQKDPRVQAAWSRSQKELEPEREKLRAAHQAVARALTAHPFSEEVLEQAFEELHTLTDSAQKSAQSAVTELAGQLTDAERQRLILQMQKRRDSGLKLR